ncbi:MAG: magnesium-translocating P-type ATPase [Rickettsiales bacterium]
MKKQTNKPISEQALLEKLQQAQKQEREQLLSSLQTSVDGLSDDVAQERLLENGKNIVAVDTSAAWYIQLLHCFLNPFNAVLTILALISWATGDMESVAMMAAMVSISVGIKFFQEYRSSIKAEELKNMVRTNVTVSRVDEDGLVHKFDIDMEDLVVGDIVHFSAGDIIPADVRVLTAKDLFISQAMLTGESLPVEKFAEATTKPTSKMDLQSIGFMGTNVVSGSGSVVVLATGRHTYFGSLAKTITGERPLTTFDIGVNNVTWLMIKFICMMAPTVLFINRFSKGNWTEALLFAVSIAVGLTPGMLPMIVTSNLAKGAIAMSKRKVVVKRLNAIQNFGAMDVLCTDKTGTLTQDHIILHDHLDIDGEPSNEVLDYAWLNSYHQTGLRNLLDVAVIDEAKKEYPDGKHIAELKSWQKIDEIPFDFQRRRMSVIVSNSDDKHILICKGAVEELLAVSVNYTHNGKVLPLDDAAREKFRALAQELNEDGFRVLIVSYKNIEASQTVYDKRDESTLTIKGFLTFLDPPKETARVALAALKNYGVDVKVLTGDNATVTRKICNDVKLEVKGMVDGSELDKLTDSQLYEAVEKNTIFAKLSPMQKSRIILALKAAGHTVGFLGDGINDAPALRVADVGISVDTAADIAKEAADIILLEKSLLVLEEGVIEGRKVFGNIVKYLKMALSSNFGNMFSVVGASFLLPFLPMLPVQILIQNLLYDISQIATPFDKVDDDYLRTPRKWEAIELKRFMLFIGPVSSIFDYITFGVMWFIFSANTIAEQSLFHTGWFVSGLLTQTLIVHMIRTEKMPFIGSRASNSLLISTVLVMAAGIILPYTAAGAAVHLVPLPLAYFGYLAGILIGYCLLVTAMKSWYIKKFGQWL